MYLDQLARKRVIILNRVTTPDYRGDLECYYTTEVSKNVSGTQDIPLGILNVTKSMRSMANCTSNPSGKLMAKTLQE